MKQTINSDDNLPRNNKNATKLITTQNVMEPLEMLNTS